MKYVHIGGESVPLQGGAWSTVLYDREFGSDGGFFNDLQKGVNPVFLLKAAWSMARSFDDRFPNFEDWVKSLDISELSMQTNAPWTQEVISVLNAETFRSSESKEEGE